MTLNNTELEIEQPGRSYFNLVRDNYDFRYLWTGHIVTLLGNWFNLIASATLMAQLTGSASAIGLLFVVRMLAPFLVSPLGGVVTDRFNRKHVLIATDLVRALVVLGFLLVRDQGDIWLLYALTFIQLGMGGVFFPARNAILPDIVGRNDLGTANALSAVTWSVMLAFGAALGGIAAGTLGVYAAFKIDALTYVLSALLVSRINYTHVTSNEDSGEGIKSSAYQYLDGLKYLRRHVDVLFIALNKAALTFFSVGVFHVVQVRISEKVFVIGEGGSTGLGLMFAMGGIGTGLGPVLARYFTGDRHYLLMISIAFGYLLSIAGMLVIAPLHSFSTVLVGIFVRALGGGLIWVFSTQLLLELVPDIFRGRVFSTEFAMLTLMSAVSSAVVGSVIDTSINLSNLIFIIAVLNIIPLIFWGIWFAKSGGKS